MNGYFTLYVAHYATFSTDLYSFRPRNMMGKNVNFKLVSLNVRGIRSFEKRKAVLNSPLSICLRGLVMKSLEPNLKHRNEARGNKFKFNTREIRNENKYSS